MSGVTNQHNLFKPVRSRMETKADITDQTARAITSAEVTDREAKTARLRAARLKSEADKPVEPTPAKKRRAKAAKP